MKLTDLKLQKSNPRFIRDHKFEKLVESLRAFPTMMELRPIVVDDDGVILGGNMRYRALIELGYAEIPDSWIKRANQLTEEQKREFTIKDNVGFGEWDWDIIANEWDDEPLAEWGLDVVDWALGVEQNSMNDEDVEPLLEQEFDPVGSTTNLMKVIFMFDSELEAETFMRINLPKIQYKKSGGSQGKFWHVNLSENYGK